MKIAIIEPHYDDAWINLGGYILKHPEIEFYIVSVCKDSNNYANETKLLGKILPNVQTKFVGLKGIPWESRNKILLNEYEDYFLNLNRNIFFRNTYTNMEEVNGLLSSEISHCDSVLLPIGAAHPQHILTSKFKFDIPTSYYYEFPYYYDSFALSIMSLSNKNILGISGVLERKIQIFKEIYRSQKGMLLIKSKLGLLEDISEEVIFSNIPDYCIFEPPLKLHYC